MRTQRSVSITMFALLIGLIVFVRVSVHMPNFSPTVAVALFAGFWFARRPAAVIVPVAGLALSDMWLGAYAPGVMLTVYAALLLPVLLRGVTRFSTRA